MRGTAPQFLVFLQLIHLGACKDRLNIRYEWKQIDYQFPSPEYRQQAIENRTFIPENNIPIGIEVWRDKLFITVLRWKPGVPASLNYINLNGTSESPKLIPYPNWEAHFDNPDGNRQIVAPFRLRADRCDRLWVIDSGRVGRRNNQILYPPAITVFDLKTDDILRKYLISDDESVESGGLGNIAIEDTDCQDTYAYVADYHFGALVVYSWQKNESWRINHKYLKLDPIARNFNMDGFKFSWNDGVLGLGISKPNPDSFSTLYFHPLTSFNEFFISTKYLRNKSLAESDPNAFKCLGTRGPNKQALASFLDKKTGVLFYSLTNQKSIACWNTNNEEYNVDNQGLVYKNNATMVIPTDIKVDYNDNIWVVSNNLHIYMYSELDLNEVNFRIFGAPVMEAIRGTACDVPKTN